MRTGTMHRPPATHSTMHRVMVASQACNLERILALRDPAVGSTTAATALLVAVAHRARVAIAMPAAATYLAKIKQVATCCHQPRLSQLAHPRPASAALHASFSTTSAHNTSSVQHLPRGSLQESITWAWDWGAATARQHCHD